MYVVYVKNNMPLKSSQNYKKKITYANYYKLVYKFGSYVEKYFHEKLFYEGKQYEELLTSHMNVFGA